MHSRFRRACLGAIIRCPRDRVGGTWLGLVRPHCRTLLVRSGMMGRAFRTRKGLHSHRPGRRLYCRDDGAAKRVGDWVYNPEIRQHTPTHRGRGLRCLFNSGELGDRIVQRYARTWRSDFGKGSRANSIRFGASPCAERIADMTSRTNHPPAVASCSLKMLNILEEFDLGEIGHNSTRISQGRL